MQDAHEHAGFLVAGANFSLQLFFGRATPGPPVLPREPFLPWHLCRNQTDGSPPMERISLSDNRNRAWAKRMKSRLGAAFRLSTACLLAVHVCVLAQQPSAQTAPAAEQARRLQETFLADLRAFQALQDPPPAADDQRLREQIITVVQQLDTKPLIPAEARAHVKQADDLAALQPVSYAVRSADPLSL